MVEKILFSLENCIKCTQVKELLSNRNDVEIVVYPHNLKEWNNEQLNQAKSYNIFDEIQITAPILWIDGKKIIGYLRIRKWLQENV
jgi:glutaredoxin